MPKAKTVVIVADTHVGHKVGMMPANFRASSGATAPLNQGQEYLLEHYEDVLAALPRRIDVLLLNGDICEGQNLSETARALTEVDPTYQVRAAEELLAPLAKRARRVYATTGSKYHTGRGGRLDREVAERLGATRCGMANDFANPWILFRVGNQVISAHHHQSATTRYRSMPVEREIGFALEYCARTGQSMPTVFVASHVHWGFGMWRESGVVSVSTPAMKLQDDFAANGKVPWRWRPHELGFVLLRIFEEPVYGFRVHAEPLVCQHPLLGIEEELE